MTSLPLRHARAACSLGGRPSILAFLLILLALGSPALPECHAQEAAEAEEEVPVRLAGRWALQFQISRDFTLRAFEAGRISAKKHLTETRAVRLGLAFDAEYAGRKEGEEERIMETGDASSEEEEHELATQELSTSVEYLFYTRPEAARPIRFYGGGGPEVGFERTFTGDDRQTDRFEDTTEDRSTRWAAGLSGALGAEWAVHRQIGLLVEYGSTFSYRWQRRSHTEEIRVEAELVREETRRTTQRGFRLDTGRVRFGVAVYL